MIRRRRRLQERRDRQALLSGIENSDNSRGSRRRRRNRRQITRMVESIFPSWLSSRSTTNGQQLRARSRQRNRSDQEEYIILSIELLCLFYVVICFAILMWFKILAYTI